MTRFLGRVWFLWLMMWTVSTAQAVNIKDIYYNRLSDKAQVILVADGILEFEKLNLSNPPRLVVDIRNGRFNGKKSFQVNEGAINQVRSGYFQNTNFRIVIDLNNPVKSQVYKKAKTFGGEQQVIIDIFDNYKGVSATPPPIFDSNNPKPISLQLESLSENNITVPPPLFAVEPNVSLSVNQKNSPEPAKPLFNSKPTVENSLPPNPQPVVKKTVKKTITTTTVTTVVPATKSPLKSRRDIVIAIDPGHGGKDPGARNRSTGLKEKDVVLQIGKRLKQKIDAHPGFRAIMTRDRDIFIPLQQRAKIARRNNADLFVSIHADAVQSIEPSGSSVYILSTKGATSQLAKYLENSENSVDLRWGVDVSKYNDDIQEALLTIQQEATLESSFSLAEKTLNELKSLGKVHKRNVERANFVVLRSPEIPSMLVETAFISNPDEARKLASPSYQDRLAAGIANGIFRYFEDHLPQHRLLGQ